MNKTLFRHKLRLLSTVVRLTTNYNHMLIKKKSQYAPSSEMDTLHWSLSAAGEETSAQGPSAKCNPLKKENTIIFNHYYTVYYYQTHHTHQ